MIKLREYQEKCINDIRTEFGAGNNRLIITAPTGAGKTVIFSELARRTAQSNNNVLVLTNRIELLNQAGGSFERVGLKPFEIKAGIKFYKKESTYVAMAQTLKRRLNDSYWIELIQSVKLIIIDEAHLQDFNFLFESEILKENQFVLGFTATPVRTGKMRQLALDYDKIVSTVSVKWLIKNNFLVDCDTYEMKGNIDYSKIGYDTLKGDFKSSDQFKQFDTPKLYKGVVNKWLELAEGTQTLVFCANVEHCIKTVNEFRKEGINAKFLVSKLSPPKGSGFQYEERLRVFKLYKESYKIASGERKNLLSQFANREFDVLVNAGILTTGYDCPTIETIIINRATLSRSLHLQMIGRGSRISQNKTHFNLFDFGGNVSRLGNYSGDVEYSLWHEEKKGDGGLPPIKHCGVKSTGEVVSKTRDGCTRPILASYMICPFCGFKYPDKVLLNGDLVLINPTVTGKPLKPISKMSHSELTDYWKMKKYKSAWLWRQLWTRGGEKELRTYAAIYNWTNNTLRIAINYAKR